MTEETPSDRPLAPTVRPALAAKTRLQVDKVSKEPILLYPEGLIQLNSTGVAILALCDGHRTFQEIVADLAVSYNTSSSELQEDVEEFLRDLYSNSLLEFRSA